MIVEPSWALGSETDETALERKAIVESLRCEHENVELAGRECVGLVGFTDKI